ncbi:hypothetical protein [Haloarchaeobius iranensis]|uniref:hypothetical protein n=1 Tax=Haloarchaeobius iranensis TaxID=996166 RepID=UPI001587BC4A|nr:hypothetical protein [Haloarchaeobius iranensis]
MSTLPPETETFVKSLIERTEEGESEQVVFKERSSIPTDGLSEAEPWPLVSHSGETYRIVIEQVERSPPLLPENWILRTAMGMTGSLLIALGGITAITGSKELTAKSSWGCVGIWVTVLTGTVAYDGGTHGLGLSTGLVIFDLHVIGVLALVLPMVGVVAGVVVRGWGTDITYGPEQILVIAFIATTFVLTLPGLLVGYLFGESNQSGLVGGVD